MASTSLTEPFPQSLAILILLPFFSKRDTDSSPFYSNDCSFAFSPEVESDVRLKNKSFRNLNLKTNSL